MSTLSHVTTQTFKHDVLESDLPVVVDFYADWCGPCRMLAPTLQKLSNEFDGSVKIVKVNVDSEPALANQFQVRSIPMLAVFVGGQLVGQSAGAPPESALRTALNELVDYKTRQHA
ncbi:MAG: thioredoxin [Pirellulales bacterium]